MSRKDDVRDQLNSSMWEHSSDELRQLQINRYVSGESDGSDIPEHVRKTVRRGGLFGKTLGIVLFAALFFWLGTLIF